MNSQTIEKPHSYMPAVLAALQDFKTPIHSVFRLIACHIAILIMDIRDTAAHPAGRFRLKSYKSEIGALRQLRSVLKLAAHYRGTEDTLNLDGPKFRLVFQAFMSTLISSIRNAGFSEVDLRNILRHFSDEMSMGERELRFALSQRNPEELFELPQPLAAQVVSDDCAASPDQLQLQFDPSTEAED